METVRQPERPDYVTTYAQVVGKADQVRALLESRQVRLNPASVLGQLMKMTEALSTEWNSAERAPGWESRLLSTLHVNRICGAILGVVTDGGAQQALKRVASNDMNLPMHQQSQGKDAFFEIELADYLRRHGMDAVLDEPDILVRMSTGDYPVACKKVNSLGNVKGQLKKGARQLRPFGGAGLIALNVDVLVPENKILVNNTAAEANAALIALIDRFREENMLVLQRPVAENACDGILFSITSMTHVEQMRPSLNYCTQTDVWSLRGQNPQGRDRAFAFAQILGQAIETRRKPTTP